RNPMLRGERREHVDRIVTYGEERNALPAECFGYLLQLNELRFAIRSPPGAAIEHDQRRAAGAGRVQVDHGAGLIREADVREPLTYLRALAGVLFREAVERVRGGRRHIAASLGGCPDKLGDRHKDDTGLAKLGEVSRHNLRRARRDVSAGDRPALAERG